MAAREYPILAQEVVFPLPPLLFANAIVLVFLKKFKSGTTSIDDVRKAQSSLEQAQENIRKAQEKMQEKSGLIPNV